jgi:hypothetical protein
MPEEPYDKRIVIALGVYLCVVFFILVATMLWTWSSITSQILIDSPPRTTKSAISDASKTQAPSSSSGEETLDEPERQVLGRALEQKNTMVVVLVLVIGALGGVLYGMIGYCIHLSLGDFNDKWFCWYLFRPLMGAGMSLVLFLATRGGFISLGSSVSYGDLYGTAALSVLSGMFSEQVSKKLAEIFGTLFRTESDAKRRT